MAELTPESRIVIFCLRSMLILAGGLFAAGTIGYFTNYRTLSEVMFQYSVLSLLLAGSLRTVALCGYYLASKQKIMAATSLAAIIIFLVGIIIKN